VYPGVEIHATTVDNLLSGTAISRPRDGVVFVIAVALALLCCAALLAIKPVMLKAVLGLAILAAYVWTCFAVFESNVWLEMLYPSSSGLAAILGGTVLSYGNANRQRKQIRTAFSQYLSPAVVEQLSKHPEQLRLGGEQRTMTAHFSDLEGFTSFSEKLTPSDLVHLLNRYLTITTDTILENAGTLDKYIGDAIVAFWNAPLPCEDHARRACEAVLEMRTSIAGLNGELEKEGLPKLKPRTGLNTGLMTVGNMGSSRRFDYTMMGSAVNLASRLEGVNKAYGTYIMVSGATRDAAGPGFAFRELDTIRVVGQRTPVIIFELLGRDGEVQDEMAARVEAYGKALALYRSGRFAEAASAFGAIADDPPSRSMAARCLVLEKNLAADKWDGVFDMTSK